ncbi:hypothetical protein LEP1GSC116_2289 [Leptospira interrogans serovar Icterohaemorrhagiae str. Verdun HP]|uniref:Lipoprotein n=4 Tax=Leptospira interrogans TaxID=173 RepID=M6RC92_LEPIR|nr:hypothetical protein LEP1GSC148_0717 [Leptospira interrogans serovar Canicola str. LT1962]EMM94768.1 hypothetical protein LEP1GSC158_1840 [Leptospira interrogans serovar Zanoni str. LT2156]EMO05210.1 hypothetical protein LEP1GSC116_2289 [Leptospira interrogans serovar Icterohaemorrhagiae str. Verdun HP]EMY04676.1 hypothetical protein LEP1GSC029_4905 [Leptospira interrogans str. 2002000626]EMY23830.1 hypothetical protein LEP1GSC115_3252 [Leptospira interrogans serovar Australis str. 200703203
MIQKSFCFVLIVLFLASCTKSKKEDLQGGVFTFIKGNIKLYDKAGKIKKQDFLNLFYRKIKLKPLRILMQTFN